MFDVNPPILTPVVTNRFDLTGPSSQVRLAGTSNGRLELAWSGEDGNGSGVVSYDIYVTRNGAPYEAWLLGSLESSGTFEPAPDSHYAFYSIATDATGNRELAPATADCEVEVLTALWMTGTSPVVLKWAAAPGKTYAVERTTTLGSGSWQVVGGPISTLGGTATFTDSAAPETKAFYRVRKW